jgi:hypothetical protein
MDKKYYESIQNKKTVFANAIKTRKSIQTTMITTFGLKQNNYSAEIVPGIVLDDLFD